MDTEYTTDILARVRRFMEMQGLLDIHGACWAGFSGGADSTALLLILRRLGVDVTAVHLHHGLRGEDADRDASLCEAFCVERGIRFELHRFDVPANRRAGESVESAARRCRLDFWRQRIGENCGTLALGHHADDAIETLLMRLVRGSNASGLTGLRPLNTVCGVRIIRPLLELRRSEIERFLREAGIDTWCEDRTNADIHMLRNAVRHVWLPAIRTAMPGADAGLLRALEVLRDDADFIEAIAETYAADLRTPRQLHELPPALRGRVLRVWLRERTGRDIPLSHAVIVSLNAVLDSPRPEPRTVRIAPGVDLIVECDRLRVREAQAQLIERSWDWRACPRLDLVEIGGQLVAEPVRVAPGDAMTAAGGLCEVFAEESVPAVLTVRARRPGDRLVPFGRKRSKKLQDVLVNAKVPRELRDSVPLVVAGGQVIWAVGVCRAEFARVQDVPGGGTAVRFYFLQGPQDRGFLKGLRRAGR